MRPTPRTLLIALAFWAALFSCAHAPEDPYRTLDKNKSLYRETGEIRPLLDALAHSDLRVRSAAAAFLGGTGDARAVPALRERLNDRSRYVREEAAEALRTLGETAVQAHPRERGPLPDTDALQRSLAMGRVYTLRGSGFPLGKTSVRSLDFSPDGRFIAAGYNLGGFVLWDAVEGHLYAKSAYYNRTRYYRSSHFATSVRFTPDEKGFAVGEGASVEVRGMDGRPRWEEPYAHGISAGFGDIGTTVALSGADPLLASAGRDGAVRLWNVSDGRPVDRLRAGGAPVPSLVFSPDGRWLAAGDTAGTVRIWDTNTRALHRSLETGPSEVSCLAFDGDGALLMAGTMDGALTMWDPAAGRPLGRLRTHGPEIRAMELSPEGSLLATCGEDGEVILWDLASAGIALRLEGHESWVEAAAFSPDGSLLATGGKDGTLRLWNTSSGEELLKLINLEFFDWIAVTPDGGFNASPGASEHFQVGLNDARFPLEHIFSRCFRPDAVRRTLAQRSPPPRLPSIERRSSPPSVEILSPENGAEITEGQVRVTVSAGDTGDGIASVNLYHNGKNVSREGRRGIQLQKDGRVVRRFEVTLVAGENRFQAVAASENGIESERKELIVFCRRPGRDADLHVLAVGIDRYRNPDLNLDHAAADARSVAAFFRDGVTGLFRNVHVVELLDDQATGDAIRTNLERLAAATQPGDVVVLYLCGHGEALERAWYFLPHDLVFPEREKQLRDLGISSHALAQLLQRIPARKVLLAMDACKSGAALVSFRSYENRRALMQLARATGVYVVASSSSEQLAAEVHALGHGIFTYTLLQGLKGKAVSGLVSAVTVKRLLAYVEEQLPLLSLRHRQAPQYPVVYSRGMDFPIAPAVP